MTKEDYEKLSKNDGSWGYSATKNQIDLWNRLPPHFSNEETIEKIREYQATGDKKLFNNIVYGCLGLTAAAVCRIQRGLVNSQCAAYPSMEDLFQEAFFTLKECIDLFDSNKSKKFSTFLFGRIKWKAKNLYNRRRSIHPEDIDSLNRPASRDSDKEIELQDLISDDYYIVDRIHDKLELKTIINEILPMLKKQDREMFLKYHLENKSQAEIAKEYGTYQMNVGRTIRRVTQNILRIYEHGISAVHEKFFDEEAVKSFKEGVGSQKFNEDSEIGKIISQSGGLKTFARDFMPTLRKVSELQFFKMYYVEKKTISEIVNVNACEETVVDVKATKRNVDEQIMNFAKSKKGNVSVKSGYKPEKDFDKK